MNRKNYNIELTKVCTEAEVENPPAQSSTR